MATINFDVKRYGKKMTPDNVKLGKVGDKKGNTLVFHFDEFVKGFGVLEIVKPTAVSTNPETSYKYALERVGDTYTADVDTKILDTNCIAKLRVYIEHNDVQVFKSTPCLMYIDGNLQADINELRDEVDTLNNIIENEWKTWTPVFDWTGGSPTVSWTAKYLRQGVVCEFKMTLTTEDGDGATGLAIDLPVKADAGDMVFYVQTVDTTSTMGFAVIGGTPQRLTLNNFAEATASKVLTITIAGSYEVAEE